MLRVLRVKDFALIREAELKFSPGLNLITGETGAGKSLLIGALGGLLGGRMGGDFIRQDAARMVIEGEFSLEPGSPAGQILKQRGEDPAEPLILRRETQRNGRTRLFLNDSPTTLKRLQELGDALVDLCGQHEHQSLLRVENHLDYLDRFAGLQKEQERFARLYRRFRNLTDKLKRLKSRQLSDTRRLEIVEFEIREIETVNPLPDEEETMLQEEKALQHNEQLKSFCYRLEEELSAKPGAVLETLAGLRNELEKLAGYVPQLKTVLNDFQNASVTLQEAVRNVLSFRNGFDFSPQRLEEIRDRLGALAHLKRKFGGSIASVIEHREKLKWELEEYSGLENEIGELNEQLSEIRGELVTKAGELSENRRESVPALEESMLKLLSQLELPHARMEFRLGLKTGKDITVDGIDVQLSPGGINNGEIYISTNPGEPLKPMSTVASGGEISRIMLALKSVIAGRDRVGSLIFDEIDNGISGRVASKVGRLLLETSGAQQVIAVTHLPQIASLPSRHFSAMKVTVDNCSESRFLQLDETDRVQEIASLLTTGAEAGQGEDYARQLLNSAQNIFTPKINYPRMNTDKHG